MVRKRSCPAVSQICSLMVLPSSWIVRIFCVRGRKAQGGEEAERLAANGHDSRRQRAAEDRPSQAARHAVPREDERGGRPLVAVAGGRCGGRSVRSPWPDGNEVACAAVWAAAYEIHANRRNVALGVRVIGEAQQEA